MATSNQRGAAPKTPASQIQATTRELVSLCQERAALDITVARYHRFCTLYKGIKPGERCLGCLDRADRELLKEFTNLFKLDDVCQGQTVIDCCIVRSYLGLSDSTVVKWTEMIEKFWKGVDPGYIKEVVKLVVENETDNFLFEDGDFVLPLRYAWRFLAATQAEWERRVKAIPAGLYIPSPASPDMEAELEASLRNRGVSAAESKLLAKALIHRWCPGVITC